MKIDIDSVNEVINDKVIDDNLKQELVIAIQELAKQIAAEKEVEASMKVDPPEKEWGVVDSHGSYWVIQIETDKSSCDMRKVVDNAIASFNNKNGKKKNFHPITGLSDAFEFIPSTIWKEFGITIKTKAPAMPYVIG